MSALYRQVCDQILEQIQHGALKVGDRLPPEAEYAAQIGVSRSTLRLAFAELETSGVLRRRKRSGTEIISDRPKQRFSMATSGLNDLLSLGRDTTLAIHSTRLVQGAEIAQLAGLDEPPGAWLEVHGARSMVGAPHPFSVNRVYVPERYADIRSDLGVNETSVFRLIEERHSIAVGRVSQTVRAIACSTADAGLIGLPPGAPVLQIEAQLTTRDGTLIEISLATFDPDRFQVRTDVEIG